MSDAGTGVDIDAYFLVSYSSCGPGSLGSALNCGLGEDNRPTIGQINLCRNVLKLAATSPKRMREMKALAIHELMHALGMSASSFPNFIDRSSGTPYNTDSPKKTIEYNCGNIDSNTEATVIYGKPTNKWPDSYSVKDNAVSNMWKATNVVDFTFNERGIGTNCPLKNPPGTLGLWGECVQKVITKAVRRESRKCK